MRIVIIINILTILILSKSFGQKIEKIYLNNNDSTSNRYLAISPPKLPWKGVMFLVPSFGETPEGVLEQTDLPILAAQQGLVTIIPTFKTGLLSLGIDSLTQQSFKELIIDVDKRYKLHNLKFYVGGFSIGGTCAVKFTELAIKDNFKFKPVAIFAVDAPLDFEGFYKSYKRMLRLAPNSEISKEAAYMIGRIEEIMNGTPENVTKNYYKYSPYSFSDTTQTAIKYLVNTPITYYSEPDINWWIKEYNLDYSGLNVLDGSCMINELKLLGNAKANLVITQDKGYRKPNNSKQPHSWSIIDNPELIRWLLSQK
jgi:hypothetical protein